MVDRFLGWLSEHGKPLRVKVTTMDADLNAISVERDAHGQQLFETVCKIIGLREVWYFGLCFTNRKGFTCWLQLDKKIRSQGVPRCEDGSLHFLFLVKFFPESIKVELIQDTTRHLFFLQLRQSILAMDLYCPPDAASLLAVHALQALYGDHQPSLELDLRKILPLCVLQQYEMDTAQWEHKIRTWWTNNSGLSREEAEEEFLCVAEELDMYGTQYYPIKNQKDTELLLGVSPLGVGIYEPDNKLSPRPFFPWTEIKCISFKHKMFTICTADKSKIRFRAQDMSINQSLLDLCVGTHNLYLRRRQPDLLEVQQMRQQANELRQRRAVEQTRLHSEREERTKAELERDRYRAELNHLSEQLNTMQNVVKNAEETHQLITERARQSEQDAMDQARRATDAEAEVQRVKIAQLKAEEAKKALERRVREAEMAAQRAALQQQHHHRHHGGGTTANGVGAAPPPYSDHHHAQQQQRPAVVGQRHSQQQQRQMTLSLESEEEASGGGAADHLQRPKANGKTAGGSGGALQSPTRAVPQLNGTICTSPPPPPLYSGEVLPQGAESVPNGRQPSIAAELQHIYAEMEQSRSEYDVRNRSLRERLADFRAELDALRREGTDTDNDRCYAEKVANGCFDKYSTLRKSARGSAQARARMFDELAPPDG